MGRGEVEGGAVLGGGARERSTSVGARERDGATRRQRLPRAVPEAFQREEGRAGRTAHHQPPHEGGDGEAVAGGSRRAAGDLLGRRGAGREHAGRGDEIREEGPRAVLGVEHVGGLQVAVDEAHGVQLGERADDLARQGEPRGPVPAGRPRIQRHRRPLHHEEGALLPRPRVPDGHDPRPRDGVSCPGLEAPEGALQRPIPGRRAHLERHHAPVVEAPGPVEERLPADDGRRVAERVDRPRPPGDRRHRLRARRRPRWMARCVGA